MTFIRDAAEAPVIEKPIEKAPVAREEPIMKKIEEAIRISERYQSLIKRLKLDEMAPNNYLDLSNCNLVDEDLVFIDHFFKSKDWKIVKLWLCENKLTKVPIFTSFPCLDSLFLEGNQITEIGNISPAPKLKVLDLKHNQLIGEVDFSGLCLQILYLIGNKITRITGAEKIQEILSDLPPIQRPKIDELMKEETIIGIIKTLLETVVDKERVKKALFDDSETGQKDSESFQKLRKVFEKE